MSVKLHEAYCLDSVQDRLLFYEDFLGDSLRDLWLADGVGSSAVVDAVDGGVVRLTTGAATNNTYRIGWGNFNTLLVSKKVTFEARIKLSSVTNIITYFGLPNSAITNWVLFYFAAAADTNWRIYTNDVGSTGVDSGVLPDTSYHIYRVECFPTGEVHFYIDGVETANSPITTDIPSDYLIPYISIQTKEDLAKTMDIDYVVCRQEI